MPADTCCRLAENQNHLEMIAIFVWELGVIFLFEFKSNYEFQITSFAILTMSMVISIVIIVRWFKRLGNGTYTHETTSLWQSHARKPMSFDNIFSHVCLGVVLFFIWFPFITFKNNHRHTHHRYSHCHRGQIIAQVEKQDTYTWNDFNGWIARKPSRGTQCTGHSVPSGGGVSRPKAPTKEGVGVWFFRGCEYYDTLWYNNIIY